jgi:NAD(P)H-dependent FMN reductase
MNKPKIAVILGSIREDRAGKQVAEWFMHAIHNFEDADIELIDLKDHPMPLLADAISPMQRGTEPHSIPAVQSWLNKIKEADGFVFITAEYNHSVPGALKNAIDYGYTEWNNKSIGFVSYGSAAGGSRAVEHLRQIASELQMHDIRDQIIIPTIWNAFDENGKLEREDSHAKTALSIIEKVSTLAAQLKLNV